DDADVRPVAENRRVYDPGPVIERFVNDATPLVSVTAVVAPPSVPPPDAIVATTITPASFTSCFDTSRSCTPGWWANAIPLVAEADGCVTIARAVAGFAGPPFCVVGASPAVLVPVLGDASAWASAMRAEIETLSGDRLVDSLVHATSRMRTIVGRQG